MNLLVTGAWQCTDEQLNELRAMGHKACFMQYEKDTLPCEYDWVEGVICNGLFLHHAIEKLVNLKYIQLTSAGYDRVPMDYIKEHEIEIHNARGVYSIPMAEFAVCGVLQIYKQSHFFYENQKQHKWEKHRGLLELSGKTVLIVGCGSVGTECAKRFSAFGCKVIGVDLLSREDSYYSKIVEFDTLDNLIPEADIVVLTVPLTDDTCNLISRERISLLKKTAVIVNIARGAVVDTGALIEWLQTNPGSSAVLDVFENEPLNEDHPLWNMENVIVTPHNSFVGDGNKNRLFELIINFLRNKDENSCSFT